MRRERQLPRAWPMKKDPPPPGTPPSPEDSSAHRWWEEVSVERPDTKEDSAAVRAVWSGRAVRSLLDIIGELNSEHGAQALLTRILDSAIKLTKAERGFLLEREAGASGGTDTLAIRVARNLDGADLPVEAFPVSRRMAEEVAKTGKPLVSDDAVSDPSLGEGRSLGTHSVLAVPLRSKARVIGAVWLEHRFTAGVFGRRELELAQTLADQAGTALENARLMELTRRRSEELEATRRQVEELNKKLSDKVEEQGKELEEVREILTRTREEFATRYRYDAIIGRSPALERVLKLLDRVTETDLPVLIEGESGTGKELVARALHANGPRAKGPFVSENCGAVPEGLLEATLFGHVRGAFTGAAADKKGLFEVAHGGTLFLDEVGEMSAAMQVKLLRALQEGEVRRVGANAVVHVDVRVIAATNRNLREEVKAGRFREDLFYRLNVVRVELPALRDRKEDIPLLSKHFLEKFAREIGRKGGPTGISEEAMVLLIRHPWPGNVRQLENVLKNAYVLSDTPLIEPVDLEGLSRGPSPLEVLPPPVSLPVTEADREEWDRIKEALEKAGGNVAAAAAAIGMPKRTFYYKLTRMGLARRGPRR